MLSTIFNCLKYTLKKNWKISEIRILSVWLGFPGGSVVKNLSASAGDAGSDPDAWVRKFLWSRKWQPTPVLLPGKSQGQRNMMGYSPWDSKESDLTDPLSMHTCTCKVIWTLYCFGWCLLELSVQSTVLPWTPPSCLLPLPRLTCNERTKIK